MCLFPIVAVTKGGKNDALNKSIIGNSREGGVEVVVVVGKGAKTCIPSAEEEADDDDDERIILDPSCAACCAKNRRTLSSEIK